jgi:hypothetical protein
MYLCSYCRHFMVLIPLESRGKNLFIHVYKSKWPKISLSRVLTQPVLYKSVRRIESPKKEPDARLYHNKKNIERLITRVHCSLRTDDLGCHLPRKDEDHTDRS